MRDLTARGTLPHGPHGTPCGKWKCLCRKGLRRRYPYRTDLLTARSHKSCHIKDLTFPHDRTPTGGKIRAVRARTSSPVAYLGRTGRAAGWGADGNHVVP